MCGIYGQLVRSAGAVDLGIAEVSLDRLVHRGPDARGTWSENGAFLGSRRLRIIDIEGGQQPMSNEDRSCVIVFNGELYNFLDLRPQLESKGHRFRTRSDTEVVLRAYEEWGPACLDRFNGMFAFGIWDGRTRTLFLARDRLGEKPLYYYADHERLDVLREVEAARAAPLGPSTRHREGTASVAR